MADKVKIEPDDPYWEVVGDEVHQRVGTPVVTISIFDDGIMWRLLTKEVSGGDYSPAKWSDDKCCFVLNDEAEVHLSLKDVLDILQTWKDTWGSCVPSSPCPSVSVSVAGIAHLASEREASYQDVIFDLHDKVSLLEKTDDQKG